MAPSQICVNGIEGLSEISAERRKMGGALFLLLLLPWGLGPFRFDFASSSPFRDSSE